MDVWVVKFEERDSYSTIIGVATTVEDAYRLAVEWSGKGDVRAPFPLEAFRGSWAGELGHDGQPEWYDASFVRAMRMGCTALDDDYEGFAGYYIKRLPLTKPKPMEESIPFSDLKPGMKAFTGMMYSRAVVVVSLDYEKSTVMIRDARSPDEEPHEFDGGRLFAGPPMGSFVMTFHDQDDQSVSDQPNGTQDA